MPFWAKSDHKQMKDAAGIDERENKAVAKFERTFGNRRCSDRTGLRYPSDVTDEEWSLIERIIPPAKRGGNKRTIDIRRVVDGLMYVLTTGCQWTAIPKDLPPRTSLNEYFRRWDYDGTLVRIHQMLCGTCQEPNERLVVQAGTMIGGHGVKLSDGWTPQSVSANVGHAKPASANGATW
jgi:transposase